MTKSFPNWITKRMLKGVKGLNLDAYLLALEGWRRGLTLTWYHNLAEVTDMQNIELSPLGKSFSLEANNEQAIHYFYRSRGDKVLNEAVDSVQQKYEMKKHFNKSGILTPKGFIIDRITKKEDMLNRISSLNYPLVVKLELSNIDSGITTQVQDNEELFNAIEYMQTEYKNYDQFIIEEYVEGEEYRAYVVDDQVVAVTKCIPANITGNGLNTIKQLVKQKNEERKSNPYLAKNQIKLDDRIINFLHKQDRTLDEIPQHEEFIQLNDQINISAGGDPIDATDDLNESQKKVVVQAIQSIPGLIHAGVDIIISENLVTVLDVDETADISMHIFPEAGKPRNVSANIINYYFPETLDNAKNKTGIYFDYKGIQSILRENLTQQLTLTNTPSGTFSTARYIIQGKVQKVGFRKWVRKQAIQNGLHGYTRNLDKDKVVVVVGGNEKAVEKFEKLCAKGPAKSNVEKVNKLDWKLPIKLGFEIRRSK